MGIDEPTAWCLLVVGIFFWSACYVPVKLQLVRDAAMHPLTFALFQSVGIATSTAVYVFIVASVEGWPDLGDLVLWPGVVGASIWTPANLCSILAVDFLGVGAAQGTWSALIVIVSFAWGIGGAGELWGDCVCSPESLPIALVAIGFLVAGIVGVAFTSQSKDPAASAGHGADGADGDAGYYDDRAPSRATFASFEATDWLARKSGQFYDRAVLNAPAPFAGGGVGSDARADPESSLGIRLHTSSVSYGAASEGGGGCVDEVDLGGGSGEYRYADAASAEGAAAAPPSPREGARAVAWRRNILLEISPSGVRCARLTLGFATCIAAGVLTGTTNVPVEFTAKADEFRVIYTCAFAGSVLVFNSALVALLALCGVAQRWLARRGAARQARAAAHFDALFPKAFGASLDANPAAAEQNGGEASGSSGRGGGTGATSAFGDDSLGSSASSRGSARGAATSGRSSRSGSRLSRAGASRADSSAGAASAFGGSAAAPLTFGGLAPPVVLCCVLSGVMWNVGNICSILVTVSPLGLTIGLPLGQLALVGACVIGIVLFKEVEGWLRLALFSGCVAVTAAAAVLLGVYGRCKECAPLA